MKLNDILDEEGGTLKLKSGQLLFNTTKQRNKDLKAISKEILNLNAEIKKLGNTDSKKLELLKKRLEKLNKDRIKIAAGKKSEYTTGGNFFNNKSEKRVDNINFDDGNPNDVKNWAKRMETEKEISDKLNKQKTKIKYIPR